MSSLRPTQLPEMVCVCVCVEGDEGLSDGKLSSFSISISVCVNANVYENVRGRAAYILLLLIECLCFDTTVQKFGVSKIVFLN